MKDDVVCYDSNGEPVRIGDKIRGVGSISFRPGDWTIDRTPIVTVRRGENGRIYFGGLSKESFFDGFYKIKEETE